MNETLILILGQTPDSSVKWAFYADGQVRLAHESENVAALTTISDRAAKARQVIAVLQGENATMRVMASPPRGARQYKAAAGFLLEDELAESIDDVHVIVSRHEGGAGQMLAMKKDVVEAWRDALADAGIEPDVMTCDFALLPAAPERAVIFDMADRLVGAIGLQGFAIEKSVGDGLMTSLLNNEAISDIIVYGERTIDASDRDGVTVDWRGRLGDETLFSTFAAALENAGGVNFLQGAYRKKRDWGKAAGPWRRAAMLAAACVGGIGFLSVADSIRSLRMADLYEDEALAVHQAAFPDAPTADPRAHARSVLATGGAEALFLPMTNSIADTVAEIQGVQIDRVRYNAERSEFTVNIRVGSVEQLDAFKQALAARGVVASEAGSVRRSGGYFLGELRMSMS